MFYSVFGSGEQQEWAQPTYKTLVSDSESTDYGSVEKNNIDVILTVHNDEKEKLEHHKEIPNDVYIYRTTRQRDPCFDSLITIESHRYLMYFMRNGAFLYYSLVFSCSDKRKTSSGSRKGPRS